MFIDQLAYLPHFTNFVMIDVIAENAQQFQQVLSTLEEKGRAVTMRIIIIGDGKVGFSLAENLSKENHDVIIIDKNADALRKASESLDVMCIKGNGVSTKILQEAGIQGADLLIAATTSDEMNMVCCLTAKKLGAEHTIARIRDPEYANELTGLMADLGLDMVVNPEQAAANEIAHLLRFPPAVKMEQFAKGKIDFVEVKVTGDMPIVGMKLKNIASKISSSVLIGVIIRGHDVMIPNGDMTIMAGDTIHIVGKTANIYHFCKTNNSITQKIKNIMIVGGGRIAYYLATLIADMGMKVKIIENNYERCNELAELLPHALIIHGDGTDEDFLHSENMSDMDAFVAATGRDEENLIAALLAKNSGVQKVVAKINRMNYANIIKNLDIDSIVSPKTITTNHILRFVRGLQNAQGSTIRTLYRILGEQVEAIEFIVNSDSKLINITLKKLELTPDILIAAIIRGNQTIIPHGNDRLQLGDSVIVIAKNRNIISLDDMIMTGGRQLELQDSIQKFGDRINL